jgi:hypothetical protein
MGFLAAISECAAYAEEACVALMRQWLFRHPAESRIESHRLLGAGG